MPLAIPAFPLLSEPDPRESAEGGLDPLGLYSISDALAVRLVPGVRERQKHARFLTTIAASLAVCEGLEESNDIPGATEPWLAFEWHVVEGLVRTSATRTETAGLPGSSKARQAVADKVPLSAKRYLKTPSVFGFHGVYRLLARTLGIERDGRLAETGYDLLRVWEQEQELPGFTNPSANSAGGKLRGEWRRAVESAMERGSTGAGADWNQFREHLDIRSSGPKEAAFLCERLLDDDTGHRGEVLRFLISRAGRKALSTKSDERAFHVALSKAKISQSLAELIDGIMAYETFARLCMDALDDVLVELTLRGIKTDVSALASLHAVEIARLRVPKLYRTVLDKLEPLGQAPRFQTSFASLAEPGTAADWLQRLMEHHRQTQRRKLPDGKAPWFERIDDGTFMIRPLYRQQREESKGERYVHAYRTDSLASFARDLHLLPA